MSRPHVAESVYAESEWWDGLRGGIADVDGVPHRFQPNFDDSADGWLDTFTMFPVDPSVLALEQEQWRRFVAWKTLCRRWLGLRGAQGHPVNEGSGMGSTLP
jgi:hypothetical protein